MLWLQLSKLFKFDQSVIGIALEAEKVNIERMIRAAEKEDSMSYEKVASDFAGQAAKVKVPAEADKKAAELIDSIAKPAEERMQKKLVKSCMIAAAVLVCITGGIMLKGLIDKLKNITSFIGDGYFSDDEDKSVEADFPFFEIFGKYNKKY